MNAQRPDVTYSTRGDSARSVDRMTTCPVTIPSAIDPRDNGDRGVRR